MADRYPGLEETKGEVLQIARSLGTFTIIDIRQRLPGHQAESIEKAVRQLREESRIDIARLSNGKRRQARPLLLTYVHQGVEE